jgi:dihydroorotate dehydrogenase (NAD+) catalytic subunit
VVSVAVDLAPSNPRELRLISPIVAASGCFGFGTEFASNHDVGRLGAFVTKSVTIRPSRGTRAPRVAETPAGLLSSIGLQNPGIRAVVRKYPPIWSNWTLPAIVSLAADNVDDFIEMAEILDEVPGIAGIELNLSSPNGTVPGSSFTDRPEWTSDVVQSVRKSTTLPLIAKLGPSAPSIEEISLAAQQSGADALSLINLIPGMAIDTKRRRPSLSNGMGGLSGPAIKPLALRLVYQVASVATIPVIGIGGISTINDVLEFLMAGATAVQIGTAIFTRPSILATLVEQLEIWMIGQNVESVSQIVGMARSDLLQMNGDEVEMSSAVAAG